jgi:3-hydroxybutyryl-CoA dehydratase
MGDMPAAARDGCVTMLTLQTLCFEDLSLGQTERLAKTVASSDVVGFAEVTGDRNPIHLSEHFAAKTPFGTRIAHGLYTASLISAVLGTRLPGPGAVYISQTLNFRAPVKIGDTVEVSVTVAELVPAKCRARLTCTCTVDGEIVLDGEAWVKVPSRKAPGRARARGGGRRAPLCDKLPGGGAKKQRGEPSGRLQRQKAPSGEGSDWLYGTTSLTFSWWVGPSCSLPVTPTPKVTGPRSA